MIVVEFVTASCKPLDNFNISAPNCPKADIVQGAGSLSCIHNSCVSIVVNSVSVEAAEWACWGVVGLPLVAFSNLRHVQRRSVNFQNNP